MKKIFIPILAITTLLGVVTVVKAQTAQKTAQPQFIQNLAEKLGLEQEAVSSAFAQVRQERQAQRQQEREQKLEQAVVDGIITAEQKQALLEKQAQQQNERQQHQAQMQAWFDEQGIDYNALRNYLQPNRAHAQFGHNLGQKLRLGLSQK